MTGRHVAASSGTATAVVFKGGTAIRKFVLGNEGRFSTDLDFAVADPIYADHILERLDQRVTHEGVTFVLDKYDGTQAGRGAEAWRMSCFTARKLDTLGRR
jgi:predicted nucleotidyltransferase component of viral defense system